MAYLDKKDCAACIHCNMCKYKEEYEKFDLSDYVVEPISNMMSSFAAVFRLDCTYYNDQKTFNRGMEEKHGGKTK